MVRDFRPTSHDPRSVTLEWTMPSKPGIRDYKITYEARKQYVDEAGQTQTLDVANPAPIQLEKMRTSYTVHNLVPNTHYMFSITASFLDSVVGRPVTRLVETSEDG